MEEIKDKDYSLEAVPESARKGFRSMFFVMLGFTFFSASMSVGAKLGNGLDFKEFVLACVIGGIILSIYCRNKICKKMSIKYCRIKYRLLNSFNKTNG